MNRLRRLLCWMRGDHDWAFVRPRSVTFYGHTYQVGLYRCKCCGETTEEPR